MSSAIVNPNPKKPLGRKAYGSIGHLPSSRLGPADHSVHEGQARICTVKARDKHDRVIVQEKLDGSNVAVARVAGEIIPLNRAGYRAGSSPYEQHQMFAAWVGRNLDMFDWLDEGERVCGEWLALAHGTRYTLPRGPFIAFDLMRGDKRALQLEIRPHVPTHIEWATTLGWGGPMSVDRAMGLLGVRGFEGAEDKPEGVVYRVERLGKVEFLAKYVRPGKEDGCFLPNVSGCDPIWNWKP